MRERLDSIRDRLHAAREQRVHPGRDDKVVTSWNALMLRALAEVGGALDREDYVRAAVELATFLLRDLVRAGVVLRTWKDGEAKITGFLEDVSTLADALLTVYEVTGEPHWFDEARRLCEDMVDRYHEPTAGFYDTAIDGDPLLVRPRTLDDNAVPAGRSTAALVLLRLSLLTGESRWREVAERTVSPLASAIGRAPVGLGNLAWALDLALADTREVAIAGDGDPDATRAMVRAVLDGWHPWSVLAWGRPPTCPCSRTDPRSTGGRRRTSAGASPATRRSPTRRRCAPRWRRARGADCAVLVRTAGEVACCSSWRTRRHGGSGCASSSTVRC